VGSPDTVEDWAANAGHSKNQESVGMGWGKERVEGVHRQRGVGVSGKVGVATANSEDMGGGKCVVVKKEEEI